MKRSPVSAEKLDPVFLRKSDPDYVVNGTARTIFLPPGRYKVKRTLSKYVLSLYVLTFRCGFQIPKMMLGQIPSVDSDP